MMTTPRELFERLHAPDPPLILDVRNKEEFARWKIEGPQMPETLNIPYFAFIEDEETSVAKVKSWIAGRSRDVVVVCAKGDSSEFVAEILKPHGIASQNLSGGMVQWGRDEIFRPIPTPSPLRIWQANRFGKGCLSYMIARGQDAVIVDPHRQIDDYRDFASRQGLVVRGVFDTHLHADHVSGAPSLARAEKIPYWGNPADFTGAAFDFVPVQDGARLRIGGIELMPVECPPFSGPHAREHLPPREPGLSPDGRHPLCLGRGAPGSGWTRPGVGTGLVQDDSRPAPRGGR